MNVAVNTRPSVFDNADNTPPDITTSSLSKSVVIRDEVNVTVIGLSFVISPDVIAPLPAAVIVNVGTPVLYKVTTELSVEAVTAVPALPARSENAIL